jgi:hypothetical protein
MTDEINQREGNRDHEADDHVRLRRRSDAGDDGRDEDPSGGFERGGWTVPHFDNETAMFVSQIYWRADAFLLGRRPMRSLPAPGEQWQIRATTHRGGIEHAAQVRGIDHTH